MTDFLEKTHPPRTFSSILDDRFSEHSGKKPKKSAGNQNEFVGYQTSGRQT